MSAPVLQTEGLSARYGERVLFRDLNLCLDDDKVALVGRNGAGKSTLLGLLSGLTLPQSGRVVRRDGIGLVPQRLPGGQGSPGERRRELLARMFESGYRLLLLDEPTQDLDEPAVDWLRGEVEGWTGGLLVATHDIRLLRDFSHFFVIEESGCRYLSGSFADLEAALEAEHTRQEKRYLQRLSHLAREEERTLHLARRRRRKKQYGRCRELDRASPRSRLNTKRSAAQVSHGRIDRVREQRLDAVRDWTRKARRGLKVELPLELQMPTLGPPGAPVVEARDLSARRAGKLLYEGLNLALGRGRLAVTGANGAGKTTLLEALVGKREPDSGTVRVDFPRLGVIEQGGGNWMLEESLAEWLEARVGAESVVPWIAGQKFPLALARRPLRTLSPGERVRAALIGLVASSAELLVLDEPTYSLDILGQRALGLVLNAWPGGLVVSSHNREFLRTLGCDGELVLPWRGSV